LNRSRAPGGDDEDIVFVVRRSASNTRGRDMRVTIAHEGVEVVPGQLLLADACQWGEKRIPIVTNNNDLSQLPIGWAWDLQREDGRISAEVEFNEDNKKDAEILLENHDMGLTIYANELVAKQEAGTMLVSSCMIRSLFFDIGIVPLREKAGVEL
jgi:hypothetical protein